MGERITYFVDVIIPIPVVGVYTYRVPEEFNKQVEVGKRIIVQFGKAKLYAAIIKSIHQNPPKHYEAKYIATVLDDSPILNEKQLDQWEWICNYYMSSWGEMMKTALPSSFKLSSETKILLNPDAEVDEKKLSDKEFLIIEALEVQQILSIQDVAKIIDQKNVYSWIKKLLEKEAILLEEELKHKYKPSFKSYVSLTSYANKEENLKDIFNQLERAPKQLEVLMQYISMSKRYADKPVDVEKIALQKAIGTTASIINQLVKKNVFLVEERQVDRIQPYEVNKALPVLSDLQQKAFEQIDEEFTSKDINLLFGVTASGKTEIYAHLVQECLNRGEQVLFLVPEIALTTQLINRLSAWFGEKIGVYHSRFSMNERTEIWNNVLKGEGYQIILGTRSSVFLPFSNLGLTIIDEEHDGSYKQTRTAPRYNAVHVAMKMNQIYQSKLLLGSATPAVETFYQAKNGKIGLIELKERYQPVELPEIKVVDLKDEQKKQRLNEHFSPRLIGAMDEALKNEEQIILFQNRRGYNLQLICETCGVIPMCKNCDVSLTYHKYSNELKCHYCGYVEPKSKKCNACGSNQLATKGFGTEKVEEAVEAIFPKARVKRLDLDTTKLKKSYQRIISDFEQHKIDVLVGTQMVTKGLDFDNVGLVGILNADGLIFYPHYRSFERAYQLITQVAGRSGRKKKRGKVIVQTYSPNHAVIQKVINHNYLGLYQEETNDRQTYNYPPFYRLISLQLRHRDKEVVDKKSQKLVTMLKQKLGNRVLGPQPPPVSRIRNLYLQSLLIKIEREASVAKVKKIITETLDDFKSTKENRSIRIDIDVDPI